jgi:hypothetical protein
VVLIFSLLYKNMATFAQAALYLEQLVWSVVVDGCCGRLAALKIPDDNADFRAICSLSEIS